MATWTVCLVITVLWICYLGFGSSVGLAYFLFFAAVLALMNTDAGGWLRSVCGDYAGSDAATVVLLCLIAVWMAHFHWGDGPILNYALFFAVCVAFALTGLGLSLLGSFHH